MLSLAVFIVVLGILVIVHEVGHFAASRLVGVRVERFSVGFGPRVWGVKRGGTEYLLSLFPLGGYVKLAGDDPGTADPSRKDEFLSRPAGQRAWILASGSLVNYLMAFLLFSFIFMVGSPTRTTEVGGLLPDYPGKAAGLEEGDRIVSIDGVRVPYWEDLTRIVHRKVSGPVTLEVERGTGVFTVSLTPLVKARRDIFGKVSQMAFIGILPSEHIESVRYGFFKAFGMGFAKLIELTGLTYRAIWAIVTGQVSFKDSMTGPLGIYIITGKAVDLGIIYIIHLMAVLSASLAIFNLLPLPVLDGGHLIFLALERLRGRPLAVRTQEVIANVGIGLIVLLALYVLYADVVRFEVIDKVAKVFRR